MKTNQRTRKTSPTITNLLMKLLHWLTLLELSGGRIDERNRMERLPESSVTIAIKRNKKLNNQLVKDHLMKQINLLIKLIVQLLHWISHLELSGGHVGVQDVRQLLIMSAMGGSIQYKKEIKN